MLTASSLPGVASCAGTRSSSWNHVLGQVAQHTFAEELCRLRRIVPGRGERGRELGFREVGSDERDAVERRADLLEAGSLVGLRRGMVDLEEAHAGCAEAQGARVVARAEDDDLAYTGFERPHHRLVEEAGAEHKEAEESVVPTPGAGPSLLQRFEVEALGKRLRESKFGRRITGR